MTKLIGADLRSLSLSQLTVGQWLAEEINSVVVVVAVADICNEVNKKEVITRHIIKTVDLVKVANSKVVVVIKDVVKVILNEAVVVEVVLGRAVDVTADKIIMTVGDGNIRVSLSFILKMRRKLKK